MNRKIIIVTVMLLAAAGITTASSFTTATLSRDTSINVVSDSNGVIALIDGNSGSMVSQKSNGELTIDFAAGSGSGVNVDSTYELGDPNDPSQRAFNITNQDGVSHQIELNYTVSSGDGVGDGTSNVEIQVFDASGTNVATEDEDSGTATFTATGGETFAVIVVVDTTNVGVTDSSDLSGTLAISAT